MEQPKKTFFDQLAIFSYRKWLFIIPLMLGTAIGLAVSLTLPKYYSSMTLILAEEQQVPEQYVTPTDKTPFSQRLNVITQQILSRTKLQQIAREFNLYQSSTPSMLSRISSFIFSPQDEEHPLSEDLIEGMRKDIKFEVVTDINPPARRGASGNAGNAFTITYTGRDPETTMKVTNTVASLFIEENLKVREQYAEGTSEFLSNELEKSKGEVEGYERAIKSFKEAHMGGLPEQLDSNLRTLDRLQIELQNVSANLKGAEDRRIFLEEQLRNSPAGQPPLALELDRMRSELASLRSVYKEGYPDVQILKKRIADLDSQAEKNRPEGAAPDARNSTVYGELSTVKSQIGSLRQREAQIRRQISDYERRVEFTPANEQKQSDLMRDYRISLQNYQALLEKKLDARLAENLEKRQKGAMFRVIDPANLPDSPDRPNRLLITLLGALGGGSMGTGLVFLFEILNPAFRKPEDFDGMLPVLTSIPVFSQRPKREATKLTVIKGRK